MLKYTVIRNEKQYMKYCDILETLVFREKSTENDEIELLGLLIEKWDSEHNPSKDIEPIELLKFLMAENNLKATDLVSILNLSKGTVSKILNYHKGLSKDTIRRLSEYFKMSQKAFNKPYVLKNEINRRFTNARLMNTTKDMAEMKS